ncbi:NlpC/P60 family protein [candidate division WOR-3 bacterium]|uniref:NlpC/P60 family protein n=1 Tax=candidate division WOR-3 bacterium TaxID=2052148 RepID=A0A9D5KAF9_UNCW3|nr:NlpC/P60 family protein [candidate division WOR-3 bacterium]MBD3365478.1 NlpC/P60 family protein [candidate division WOR-3 bacterium]
MPSFRRSRLRTVRRGERKVRLAILAGVGLVMLTGCVSRYSTRTAQRDALVDEIHRFKGTPYVYGGATPSGADCSGFTMTVFKRFDIDMPHGAYSQSKMGKRIRRGNLKMGDLVFFSTGRKKRVNHVGIYLWDGKMAHASSTHGVVVVTWEGNSYWEKRYVCSRRIVDF